MCLEASVAIRMVRSRQVSKLDPLVLWSYVVKRGPPNWVERLAWGTVTAKFAKAAFVTEIMARFVNLKDLSCSV